MRRDGHGGPGPPGRRRRHGTATSRVAALAVAVPAAGYLLGLALVLLVTGTRATDLTVWPKPVAALVLLAIGALAPLGVAVPACAAVVVALALWMVLIGPGEADQGDRTDVTEVIEVADAAEVAGPAGRDDGSVTAAPVVQP